MEEEGALLDVEPDGVGGASLKIENSICALDDRVRWRLQQR